MDGVINVLKPPGMSSSNVVQDIRHLYQEKRAGHTGTLDPGAAGVLPVCIGRATRLFDYLVDKEKEYIAEIAFGIATDTLDAYGTILRRSDKIVSLPELEAILPAFCGEQIQVAPMYSALKLKGQKLYDLARQGIVAERKERKVFIRSLEVISQTAENRFLLKIECSRGTYVRTLCDDIGKRLGTEAYMSFLLRTRSGAFGINDAHSIMELTENQDNLQKYVLPIENAVSFLPEIVFESSKLRRNLLNGCRVNCDNVDTAEETSFRIYNREEFLGIGKVVEGKAFLTFQVNPITK